LLKEVCPQDENENALVDPCKNSLFLLIREDGFFNSMALQELDCLLTSLLRSRPDLVRSGGHGVQALRNNEGQVLKEMPRNGVSDAVGRSCLRVFYAAKDPCDFAAGEVTCCVDVGQKATRAKMITLSQDSLLGAQGIDGLARLKARPMGPRKPGSKT
jgi:hypothetical protein